MNPTARCGDGTLRPHAVRQADEARPASITRCGSPPAAIGGVCGLIEGNPQQLLIQFYGVAVTLVWSAGMTFVLLKLVSAFVPLRVSREHELEASISRSMARLYSKILTIIPFVCPSHGHDYVDSLSRLHFNQV